MDVNWVLEIIRYSFRRWAEAFDNGRNLSDVHDGTTVHLPGFPVLQVLFQGQMLVNGLMEYNYNSGIMHPLVTEMAIWT